MTGTILIPVHNRRELTLSCLRHLEETGDLCRFQALIIDSGSTDGTGDAVRASFPNVAVLRGPATWWWTAAIAAGMARAFAEGASGVVWLNDDVRPAGETLAGLAAFAGTHPQTIAAPVCRDAVGRILPTAFRGRHNVNTLNAPAMNVDGVSGFCVWVPRAVWDRTGLPDAQRFPHYYGDTAYMLRARRAGCSVALLTTLTAHVSDDYPRAVTVRQFRRRISPGKGAWRTTFVHEKSPFRLATQWHYLRLRYGSVVGPVLTAARFVRWQAEYAASGWQRGP